MRILIVSTQFPYPPRSGFETRVYQLARQLASRHEVTLLSYGLPADRAGASALGPEMAVEIVERAEPSLAAKRAAQIASIASPLPYACREVRSAELVAALDRLCAATRFDVIQLESTLLCQFDLPAGPKVVLDEHNIEYELFRRLREGERSASRRIYNRVECARFERFEQAAWGRVDGCLLTSEREAAIVTSHAPRTATAVVPNGVDLDYFQPGGDEAEPYTAVFNGVLDYRPNLDGALHLVEEIWPLVVAACPQAQLKLVGRGPAAALRRLGRSGVTVTGEVPDVRPHLQGAAVVTVPIRMGGGTRLKVVEGLALARPIVSTSLGAEGIAVTDRRELLIADDASSFAQRIVELFEDRALGRSLGAAGRALVEREYSWELAGERVAHLLEQLAGEPARVSA